MSRVKILENELGFLGIRVPRVMAPVPSRKGLHFPRDADYYFFTAQNLTDLPQRFVHSAWTEAF